MDTISLFRQQFKEATALLATVMQGVTHDQAHWKPPGTANPLGATYVHTLMTQDRVANQNIKGGATLISTTWANKTGLSEPPPMGDQVAAWAQWARLLQVDLEASKAYGEAVAESVDQVLQSLTETELTRTITTPFGTPTVRFLVTQALVGHTHEHIGEIACLKGLQGGKGFAI